MSVHKVRYPGPGCIVEYMQGNSPVLAVVLEEQGGRLRLYSINKRESSLQASRLLPWAGPGLGVGLTRQRMDEAMEEHRSLRASMASTLSSLEIWELTQGEVNKTSAEWLAGLIWSHPTIDHEAALGHVLLSSKSHFRFSPPDFEIFAQQQVEARLAEAEAVRIRESFAVNGSLFFQKLWEIRTRKRGPLLAQEMPEPELGQRLKELLLLRLSDPDSSEDAAIWKMVIKGLPESQHTALELAIAWGLVPEHYNFWLDRAGFDSGDAWTHHFAEECETIVRQTEQRIRELPKEDCPFVSIDPLQTLDRDDAFRVLQSDDGGYIVTVALACPSFVWPFGGPLDKHVLRRASSLYLPEGDEHMLPAAVGRDLFSLDAGVDRPAFVLTLHLDAEGNTLDVHPALAYVRTAFNLDLEGSESLLTAAAAKTDDPEAKSLMDASHDPGLSSMLHIGLRLARILQRKRIASGAVITERPDPSIGLEGEGSEVKVLISDGPEAPLAHLLVGELMILANSSLAAWCVERDIPLLFRTQDVALPREFSGVWAEAHHISRVVRALPPATLDSEPRRHAGLGLSAYATASSPIRRYVDLVNQAQVLSFLEHGLPRLTHNELAAQLTLISTRSDAVNQVQRVRPRYWKLLFFRQQGDKQWWDATIADENEAFVSVALPWAQLIVRGRRRQFGEKIYSGMPIQVRLGKISPLLNEIQVLEAREA